MIRKSSIPGWLVFWISATAGAIDPRLPVVEPSELMRRTDLIDRPFAIEDRVSRFQWHKGRGVDEIYLARTPVVFRLPPRLRYERSPQAPAVRIEGVLRREGDSWYCDVDAVDLLPPDLKRLESGVAALAADDDKGRLALARWAERRGKEFQDRGLLDQARKLEGEAIWIEAEAGRPGADPAGRWLELAGRARERQIPEPVPSALAYRGFSARLAGTSGIAGLQELIRQIETFWPDSPKPTTADAEADRGPLADRGAVDLAEAYRTASEPARVALVHGLWADATRRLFERRLEAEPGRVLELSREAAAALPDRPGDVRRLTEQGLTQSTRDLASLRLEDVKAMGRAYREALGRPEAEHDLLRRWLDFQRDQRLSATDAEGRILLADQYDELIDGRESAVALLQDAWRIDPQSKEVADAFRRRDFRKVGDRWVESPRTNARAGSDAEPVAVADASSLPGGPTPSSTLRGLTPAEVRSRLGGKPDRIVRSASQGQLVEQWIYQGATQDQYLTFLHAPGELVPKVVASYARPKSRFRNNLPR